jgi:hypothetical protein
MGYCHAKSPVCADTSHAPDSFSELEEKLPVPVPELVAATAASVTVRAESRGVTVSIEALATVGTGLASRGE